MSDSTSDFNSTAGSGTSSRSGATGASDAMKQQLDSARQTLSEAKDAAKKRATEFASQAASGAKEQGEAMKGEVSAALGTFAKAVRSAADDLSSKDQSLAAKLVQQAAEGLETVSNTLGQRRLDDLVSDVRRVGRANPGAFLLGSVLVGVALGRFVRSSGSSEEPNYNRSPATEGVPERSERTGATAGGESSADMNPAFTPSAFNAEI